MRIHGWHFHGLKIFCNYIFLSFLIDVIREIISWTTQWKTELWYKLNEIVHDCNNKLIHRIKWTNEWSIRSEMNLSSIILLEIKMPKFFIHHKNTNTNNIFKFIVLVHFIFIYSWITIMHLHVSWFLRDIQTSK